VAGAGVAALEDPAVVAPGVAGEGVAVEPQAVASSTLTIANPMNFVRIY
jgi:hypothetical protein